MGIARGIVAGAVLGMLLLAVAAPARAAACAIDNVASLLADGVPAMRTAAPAASTGPWAPFTVAAAVARDAPLRLSEDGADLARTLPPAALAAPYRWDFGDGVTALGHAATHRYARAGLYRLMVYGRDAGAREWFAFDSALVRVVPPDQMLGANLGYYLLRAVVALSGLTWPVDAALVALVLALLARRPRTRR